MKKLGSVLLIAAIVLTMVSPTFATIEEKEQQLEELEQQQLQNQEKIDQTDGELYLTQASLEEVLGNKQRLEEQIAQTDLDIENKQADLDKIQKELQKARDEVAAQLEEYANRLRVIYLNKDTESALSLLLKSRSISDFLTKLDFMKSIAEEDERVLQELKDKQLAVEKLEKQEQANLQELKKLQDALAADKAELLIVEEVLRVRQAELEAKKAELIAEAEATEQSLQAIRSSIESMKAEALRIAAEQAEALRLAQLAASQAEQPQGETVSRGEIAIGDIAASGFVWPTPGVYTITSPYGTRTDPFFGHTVFHTGLDIAGPMGSPVVAAANGIVIAAGWLDGMTGNGVIIAHPNGYETLYAHGSAVNTTVGSIVNQGDVIMFMGSTGYSTGSHLHFEVITGGSTIDPLSVVAP